MKKINRKILPMITMGAIATPIIALVSCAGGEADKLVYVNDPITNAQTNVYQNTLKGKTDHPTILKVWGGNLDKENKFWTKWVDKYNAATNVGDTKSITLQMQKGEDPKDIFSKKGIRDASAPDLFQFALDQIGKYTANKYLHLFSKNNLDAFEGTLTGGDTYIDAVKNNFKAIAQSQDGTKLFSVPYNLEGQIALVPTDGAGQDKVTISSTNVVNGYSNLWSANGFFNDGTTNLADAFVQSKTTGKLGLNTNVENKGKTEADWRTFIQDGFKKMFQSAKDKNFPQGIFDKVGNTSTVKSIEEFFKAVKNNKSFALEIGTWDYDKVANALKASGLDTSQNGLGIKSMPSTYRQWQGGWGWGLNATLNDDQVLVAEDFIKYIMNSQNAIDIYKDVNNKILATTNSITTLKSAQDVAPFEFKETQAIKSMPNVTKQEKEAKAKATEVERDKQYDAWKTADPNKLPKVQKDIIKALGGNEGAGRPATDAFNNVWGVYANTIDSMKVQLGKLNASNIDSLAKEATDKFFTRLIAKFSAENKKLS